MYGFPHNQTENARARIPPAHEKEPVSSRRLSCFSETGLRFGDRQLQTWGCGIGSLTTSTSVACGDVAEDVSLRSRPNEVNNLGTISLRFGRRITGSIDSEVSQLPHIPHPRFKVGNSPLTSISHRARAEGSVVLIAQASGLGLGDDLIISGPTGRPFAHKRFGISMATTPIAINGTIGPLGLRRP